MKSKITLVVFAFAMLFGTSVFAQMRKPAPSTASSVSATFGVTKVSVEYSSPAVKGRTIFGKLLPFDKVWRAGANSATQIMFEDDVKIGDQEVKAGTYSLFMTPKEEGNWSVYLDPSGNSVYTYGEDEAKIKETEGIIMFEATAAEAPFVGERLAYYLTSNADETGGTVALHWDNMLVSFAVATPTKELAQNSMKNYFGWYTLATTAEYYMNNDMNIDMALNLAEASVADTNHFFNTWVLAQIHAKKGNKAGALKLAMEAKALGDKEKNQNFYNGYKAGIAKAIVDWK